MKELKKSPRQQLEKFSTIFMQLGLVLVLFIVFISLEHKTAEDTVVIVPPFEKSEYVYTFDTPITYVKKEVKTIKAKKVNRTITIIKDPIVTKNNEVESAVISVPVIDKPSVDFKHKIKEDIEDEFIDPSDDPTPISIHRVTKIPVFAGCENLSTEKEKKCFDKKMNKLVKRYFNADVGDELGLKKGVNKIFTQFVIDKHGNVVDVKIRAPHSELKKEVSKVVSKIPKFTPGQNNGIPVNVRYILPISFEVK